jgi:hypothetical protein
VAVALAGVFVAGMGLATTVLPFAVMLSWALRWPMLEPTGKKAVLGRTTV